MKKLRHNHDFKYGQTYAITSVGDVEHFKDRCCLDERCKKYQLWFSKRWRDSIPGRPVDMADHFLNKKNDGGIEPTQEDKL